MASTVGQKTLKCITFRDVKLRRATPIDKVMHCFGRIFETSAGDESTFELSAPVDKIDWFLSHNWAVPRYSKLLALLLFFNLHIAASAAVAAVILAFVLTSLGKLPLFEYTGWDAEHGIYCTVVGPSADCCLSQDVRE